MLTEAFEGVLGMFKPQMKVVNRGQSRTLKKLEEAIESAHNLLNGAE